MRPIMTYVFMIIIFTSLHSGCASINERPIKARAYKSKRTALAFYFYPVFHSACASVILYRLIETSSTLRSKVTRNEITISFHIHVRSILYFLVLYINLSSVCLGTCLVG